MERISNKNISITYHPADGFTLSYISDNNLYLKKRYIGYSIKRAIKLFKNYIKQEVVYELL